MIRRGVGASSSGDSLSFIWWVCTQGSLSMGQRVQEEEINWLVDLFSGWVFSAYFNISGISKAFCELGKERSELLSSQIMS